jgi:hypothetical protein
MESERMMMVINQIGVDTQKIERRKKDCVMTTVHGQMIPR